MASPPRQASQASLLAHIEDEPIQHPVALLEKAAKLTDTTTKEAAFTAGIFVSQLAWGILCYGLLAAWFLEPFLAAQPPREQLFWLALPHLFRNVGLVFLIPGVGSKHHKVPLPDRFAPMAAWGDMAAAVLALASAVAIRYSGEVARGSAGDLAITTLVVVFNVVGLGDLMLALRNLWLPPLFGSAWYIPTFYVPALLVTHAMSFSRLLGAFSAP
jgi:hypothetical protein